MDGQTDSYFLACSIRLRDVIGSGEFGTVHRGVWSHFETDTNKMVKEEVAVKTLDHQVSQKDKVKFLQEATIMAQFKQYNIVCIRGVLTQPPVGSHILLIGMYLLNRVLSHVVDDDCVRVVERWGLEAASFDLCEKRG